MRTPNSALFALFAAMVAGESRAQAEVLRQASVMRGTRYETPYFVKTANLPGPTIVIIGGLHGDEPAGYMAARQIAGWKVTRGKLIVMPDAHREAIRRGVRGYPGNMNNMFPGNKSGNDMEMLAYEIWTVIEDAKPDLLVTLHESRDFHARDPKRYGQTFCFDFPELAPQMTRVLDRANATISPPLQKFQNFIAPFPHCPTYNAWSRLRVPATSVETSKTLLLKRRVHLQLTAVRAFFDEWRLGYETPGRSEVMPLSAKPSPVAASKPHPREFVGAARASVPVKPVLDKAANRRNDSTGVRPATANPIVVLGLFTFVGALTGFAVWLIAQHRNHGAR